ncbi:hypothetical protein PIB30_031746 [Stylosanthes scabra]|uniref:Uncharacterized protein n=1 Tax=Stylosanthes scabra TaxID=79078 RepID=A0ABU6VAR7_9FABA|nr:hypothetical protein [Stylosanthes scabra]
MYLRGVLGLSALPDVPRQKVEGLCERWSCTRRASPIRIWKFSNATNGGIDLYKIDLDMILSCADLIRLRAVSRSERDWAIIKGVQTGLGLSWAKYPEQLPQTRESRSSGFPRVGFFPEWVCFGQMIAFSYYVGIFLSDRPGRFAG